MTAPNLGRFRLLERVAQGGMGEVYRGVEIGWGGVERPVAVKLIAPDLARIPDFVTTFLDEARLSYRLNHSNVVGVRDFGQAEGTWFIAMEWVDGADLGSILKKSMGAARQAIPLRLAVLVAAEAARGLDYAHRLRAEDGQLLGLVHRDVSPSNLLVSFEGEVKVTDFGIARWRMRQAVSLPGSLKGKLGYMAPEQARGEDIDARVDVFSLGVVLYETITGKNPFTTGVPDNEVLGRLRDGRFAPPSKVMQLPQMLEQIVMRAMAPDRDQRYASAAAMREDLEQFARRESWSLSPAQLGQYARGVFEVASVAAYAETARGEVVKVKTPPRPFDQALGAQLKALGRAEGEEEEERGEGETLRGKKRTAAVPPVAHEVIAAPEEKRKPTTDLTDLIPRQRRVGWIVAGVLIAGVASVVGALLARTEEKGTTTSTSTSTSTPTSTSTTTPTTTTTTTTTPTTTTTTTPTTTPATAPAPATTTKERSRVLVKAARLFVSVDVRANVFVDEKFVGEAPVEDLVVTGGRHVVRVEGLTAGLRVLPKEETVMLKDGESRRMRVELQ